MLISLMLSEVECQQLMCCSCLKLRVFKFHSLAVLAAPQSLQRASQALLVLPISPVLLPAALWLQIIAVTFRSSLVSGGHS